MGNDEVIFNLGGFIDGEYIHGSVAYGCETADSDLDIRKIFILPSKQILSDKYHSHFRQTLPDVEYYEIQKFLQLLFAGNFNSLDLLYLDPLSILKEGPTMSKLRVERHSFLTKRVLTSALGAARSHLQGAKKGSRRDFKKVAMSYLLLNKVIKVCESGDWYVKEPELHARNIVAMKRGDEVLIRKFTAHFDDLYIKASEMVKKVRIPEKRYQSEYHNMLYKIRKQF
jgi:predicted nucleotidyltransferase